MSTASRRLRAVSARPVQRRLCRLVAMAGISLAVIAIQLSLAVSAASARCDPSRTNDAGVHYDGSTEVVPNGKNAGGLSATIENYDPYVFPTTGFTDDTVEWIMDTQTSLDHYVQVGPDTFADGSRYTFVERGSTVQNNYTDYYFDPYSINSLIPYEIDFSPNSGDEYDFFANGVLIQSLYLSNFQNPNEVQLYAELQTKASQMPGGYNNTASMSDGQLRYDTSWHTLAAAINPPPSFAGITPSSGTADHWHIWDDACAN